MQYGTQKKITKVADDTNKVETTKYFASEATVSIYYEQRIKVANPQEEMAEYLKFCRETTPEQRVSFVVERSKRSDKNGYYYVLKSWYAKD